MTYLFYAYPFLAVAIIIVSAIVVWKGKCTV